MAQTFEEYKKEVQEKLPKGFVLDESKLDKLKKAFENKETIDIKNFTKEAKSAEKDKVHAENKPSETQNKQNVLKVNEGEIAPEETNQNQDSSWKESYAQEWRLWGSYNKLEYKDASLPSKGDALSFRFYEGKSEDYAAEITYTSPYNITLRGNKGKAPDDKYFEKAVNMAVQKGTAIEFGNIASAEFKAKLLAACYKQGNAQIINGPTAEEMATWPENLKKLVMDAQASMQQATPPQKPTPNQQSQADQVAEKIKQIRQKLSNKNLEQIDWKNVDFAKDKDKIKEQLQKAGFSNEEIESYMLRKQANAGDKQAAQAIDARRKQTMTNVYKYEKEIEVDDKNQPRYDEKGNPIYKKDKDGNYIYKTNDKGQKIKTAAYKAFLERAKNNLSK